MLVEQDPKIQKWQYCVLNIKIGKKNTEITELFYLDVSEIEKEEIIEKSPLYVIAQMGEEGWEMVSANTNQSTFFFKKPKE